MKDKVFVRGVQGTAIAAVLAAGTIGLVSQTEASILIDDFTDVQASWPLTVDTVGNTQTINESGLNNVLGGTRQTSVTLTSAAFPGLDDLRINIFVAPGVFDYTSTSEATGQLGLLYDAGGAGLNADFSNQIGLNIDFLAFDYGSAAALPITATMSDGVNTATLTLSLNSVGAQSAFFSFGDFAGIGSLDLSAISSVSFEFDAGAGADFRISQINTIIPAPGAIALLGLAGLVGVRRRRR